MYSEYRQIYFNENNTIIRNGKSEAFNFSVSKEDVEKRAHRLFFTGESLMHYMWKSEYDCSGIYVSIDDSLNSDKSCKDAWCLDYSSKENCVYKKTAYKRINWPARLSYLSTHGYYTEKWRWGISASAKNLDIADDGFVRFTAEIYYKEQKEHGYVMLPDESYTIDIPSGNYDFKEFEREILLSEDKISHIDFLLEAQNYKGELYFEHPFLAGEKIDNILPGFEPLLPHHEKFVWIGINLSKKEWPKFDIKLNGKPIYKGELFERAHRYSEFEVDIPEGVMTEGNNFLEIGVAKDYPLPLRLKEIGYYTKDSGSISVISIPETAYVGKETGVLIKTKKDKTRVWLKGDSKRISASEQIFENAGLNVFKATCLHPDLNLDFTLCTDDEEIACTVERVIDKEDDNIITGSGDMIYINHEKMSDVENYLSWYMSNHIGNLITIRNIYRWGGGRRLVPEVWKNFVRIANELDIKYAHMMDGRDLPGSYCNPTIQMLEGRGFLGRQNHEEDGQCAYWGAPCISSNPLKRDYYELWARVGRENADIAERRYNYKNLVPARGKTYLYHDGDYTEDMEKAAKWLVSYLADVKFDSVRHTGPTTIFKYFYDAGYDWVGAETMYQSHDVSASAVRGASYSNGKKGFGAHLAVQWSTTPHDDEYRYRRFRLSLYLSYMAGYTEINTEEGFWHLEEFYKDFSRNSVACQSHAKQQQDFYRYVSLNTRKGDFYSSVAFLSGRYDGWLGIILPQVLGQNRMEYGSPEKSWDLFKYFYPLSAPNIDTYYKHPCPLEPSDMYSGTPNGTADIMPVESNIDKLKRYKTLIFAGYNKMTDEDSEKLALYVKGGGTLVLGWPHMSETTLRCDVVSGNHTYNNSELTRALANDISSFEESYINGEKIRVNSEINASDEDIIIRTDGGIPLLVRRKMEKGCIMFINAVEYPAENAELMKVYTEAIRLCSRKNVSEENVFIQCDETVQFTIYKREENSDIYLIAVDWYNPDSAPRNAKLRLSGNTYDIGVPFGTIVKITANDTVAAWIVSEEAVVTSVTNESADVCGSGKHTLHVAKDGILKEYDVSFDNCSNAHIDFK